MENPDLRVAMGMGPDQKGVRIRRIEPTAPESQVLKPSDVILSFDGANIANDGTGELPSPLLPFLASQKEFVIYKIRISCNIVFFIWQLASTLMGGLISIHIYYEEC